MKYTHARFCGVLATALLAGGAGGQTPALPAVEALLVEGRLADAHAQLDAQLASVGNDQNARAALGVVEALESLERLTQSLYRYGLNPGSPWLMMSLPFVRLPVPLNPQPEPLTNEAFREIVARFAADLAQVETTLASVETADVKLPLHVGMYRLDMNGDGRGAEDEALWQVFARLTQREVNQATASGFVVGVDAGDVHWLRGYCHLLAATCEMFLAYDTHKLHDYTAHLFFPSAKVKYPEAIDREMMGTIFDAIAFLHLMQFPLVEPARLQAAHGHLLAVVEQSRLSWAAIAAEADDDCEWIPNPAQKNAAIPGAAVAPGMVTAWHEVLDEAESLLQGKKLMPYWRGGDRTRGVNLRRVFYEPAEFDLVLWVQGTAAAPYLEHGPVTNAEDWRRIAREFRGQFFWFAIWVN